MVFNRCLPTVASKQRYTLLSRKPAEHHDNYNNGKCLYFGNWELQLVRAFPAMRFHSHHSDQNHDPAPQESQSYYQQE